MIKAVPALSLAAVAAAAVFISARASKPEQGAATDQPTILEVLGMEDITAPLSEQPQADSRPLGIRNNNPLNIEKGDTWQGLAPDQAHPRFAVFTDPRYGYRAAARIMRSYANRGIVTLQQIVATWAPPVVNGEHENHTRNYIDFVSSRSGIAPIQVVDKTMYPRLFEAMTQFENGQQPYSLALISEGVSWA